MQGRSNRKRRVSFWVLTPAAVLCGLVALADATDIYANGQLVVSLNPGYTIEEVNSRWGTITLDAFPEGNLYLLFAEGVEDIEALALQMQAEDPAVDEAEANYYEDTPEGIRQMVVIAVGGTYGDFEDQEITTRIGLAEAHQITRGFGVRVAVLDTGVDPDHPAFQGRLADDGFDFVAHDSLPWEEANGADDDGDGQTDEGYGHGSMVAGIVALVAPDAEILPIRVLDDEGRAEAYLVAKAIRYAVNHGADVLNLSFGVPRTISTIGHQVSYADSLNVVVIAGAGNDSSANPVYYPGAHSKALLITALDSMDVKADFADWNSKVLVSAPGTGVRSAYPGEEGWALGSGCSFATPFVAGAAALIRSAAPEFGVEAVEERIELAVDPIYQIPGNQPYEGKLGSGRIYLPLAVAGFASGLQPAAGRWSLSVGPNPTSDRLHFAFPSEYPAAATLVVDIFDSLGRRVQHLESAGAGQVWDGRDGRGRIVPAGVYYACLRGGGQERRVAVRVIR